MIRPAILLPLVFAFVIDYLMNAIADIKQFSLQVKDLEWTPEEQQKWAEGRIKRRKALVRRLGVKV